jgi:hypothetical protein
MRPSALFASSTCAFLLATAPAAAQDGRMVTIELTPTSRVQMAVWIESADGTLFRTVALTERTAHFGIGNRPGALQMNTSFRWPYGRREGVLPIWAHRRAEVTGMLFPRVIFDGRASEGHASVSGVEPPNTRDPDYCLSFTPGDESLDAVTCATIFSSNKGRYMTAADVTRGYAEPWEGSLGPMRALSIGSLYPPRQDLGDCGDCNGFPDAGRFWHDVHAIMPEIDEVTTATPAGGARTFFDVTLDEAEWPDGDYVVYVEVNREADFAPGWEASDNPGVPSMWDGSRWDYWASTTGFSGRGQPAIVYSVPFTLDDAGGEYLTTTPIGYAQIDGLDGELHPMVGSQIRDEPEDFPGSGADRLLRDAEHGNARVRVIVPTTDVCLGPMPPPDCGRECTDARPCASPLLCSPAGTCVDRCALPGAPGVPLEFAASHWPEQAHTHQWAQLSFEVPESMRGIRRYEVRVSRLPIDPANVDSFTMGLPAKQASEEDRALEVPADGAPGDVVRLDIGHLDIQTRHWIGIRAYDQCGAPGPIAVAQIETTQVHFTTVSPCFVATAAYGSPLDARIGVLRRFRDRHLMTNGVGRALVSAYYDVGPAAAAWIAEDEDRRSAARALLSPIVAILGAID